MDWITLISNILILVVGFLLGLFTKNYLPSYMDKKGENLATKEDIAEITRKTEEVEKEFKEGFEKFSSDLHFKYDFYYKQYSELYCRLYPIIIQSEYVRHFIFLTDKKEVSFEDAPFLEISPTHRTNTKARIKEGKIISVANEQENIETPISRYNKMQLCEYIIDNGQYASQKLLKAAVAYRFAHSHYSGNLDVKNSSCEDVANEEEFRLIGAMVKYIVKDYNWLKKELKMEYNESELSSGIPTA